MALVAIAGRRYTYTVCTMSTTETTHVSVFRPLIIRSVCQRHFVAPPLPGRLDPLILNWRGLLTNYYGAAELEASNRFLIARVRTFSACAYTAVCVFAHRPSTSKPYICYVRSCSVSVSVVFCRVS